MNAEIIRYGMVGGDLDAFIGKVHRMAISFEANTRLVAGCFSRNESKNQRTGASCQLEQDRIYPDYQTMAEAESNRPDRPNFIVIVTPNSSHYAIAREFLDKGFHVMCEKPLTLEINQAEELASLARQKDLLFGVAYAYSAYPMVKYARQLVAEGQLGEIINVNAEYPQEWLIDELSATSSQTAKFSGWRADPQVAGISNCVGDIGTHIEHTVAYITGLRIKRLAARADYFGHELDLNANMLLEFSNGASGLFWSSQVAIGHLNGLRVRIYGSLGSLEWIQETPEQLIYTARGQAPRYLYRGAGYIKGYAASFSRIPSGHIEGHFEAFANLYKNFTRAVWKKKQNQELDEMDLDFPSVDDGLAGVSFIHAVIKSGREDSSWVQL